MPFENDRDIERIGPSKRRIIFVAIIGTGIVLAAILAAFFVRKYQERSKFLEREARTLRLSIITDIDHCPSREAVSLDNLNKFLSYANETNSDAVASLGDNASHRLRDCSETADQDVWFVLDKLRSSGKLLLSVLGDHDISSNKESYFSFLSASKRDRAFYSWDMKGVHIIVLDTVLGGETMSSPCDEVDKCRTLKVRLSNLKKLSFLVYKESYGDAKADLKQEREFLASALAAEEAAISLTRSTSIRDRGRVSETEIEWLKKELENTSASKILVLSDHPLFVTKGLHRDYNTTNGDKVRDILEESGKQVVCISGEAHMWQEEAINGVQYYIVDEFKKNNGSWAFFLWNDEGYKLDKVSH